MCILKGGNGGREGEEKNAGGEWTEWTWWTKGPMGGFWCTDFAYWWGTFRSHVV